MSNDTVVFNNIIIGRKFKTMSGITYKKLDSVWAVPIIDNKNAAITDKKQTAAFKNTKVALTEVT